MDTTRMLGPGDGYEAEEPEARGHNPLMVVHLLLQGRYWIAVLLAVVLGAAGVALGYKLPKPTWSCSAPIQIRPMIAPVLFDRAGNIPMYDQFVATQMFNLKDQRCIDLAMSSSKWLRDGRSNSAADSEEFVRHLSVERQAENIVVTYVNRDAKAAEDGLWALIEAYAQLTDELDPENSKKLGPILEGLRTDYESQIAESQKKIVAAAAELKMLPEALLLRYESKLSEWAQAEQEFKTSQRALQDWTLKYPELVQGPEASGSKAASWFWFHREEAAGSGGAGTAAAAPAKKYTPEQIAQVDGQMRDLLLQLRKAQADLKLWEKNYGLQYRTVKDKAAEVEMLQQAIATMQETWMPPLPDAGTSMIAASPAAQAAMTLRNLQLQEQSNRRRLEDANNEATTFGDAVKIIREQQAKQKETQRLLDEAKQKLESLRVDAAQPGHIVMPRAVGRPIYKDRRIPVAAGSGLGGLLLGFTLVVVWGLLDRRLRTIDQARNSLGHGMRVLGMLPSLPKNLEDPAAASFAALCVHHIRMLLQVMPRLDGHPAIAVTSPSAGDGKTSLTLSLALSYAASGRSTLLIDCDMVGAGLTRRVNAIIRRRIGQILIRENLITLAELREALSTAQRSKKKLGEVLVDEGYVDADQLANALKTQGETSVGLLDVLRGEVLEECVADTGTPRLWILPVGSAMAEHGVTISPEGFRAVLDQARKRFDVILVDTGPIPGSIESSVAASQADGVVLTVSRGEQESLVKRASEHLRDIGARALGVVFNRATPEDFSSSYGAMSSPSIPERARERKDGGNIQAFGPMATAVVGQQKALKGDKG